MNWELELEQERAFLRDQVVAANHKLTRFANARSSCHDHLEAEGIDKLLHAAQLERDLLEDLLSHQERENALSLDALIMQQLEGHHKDAQRLSGRWHQGHTTPAGYWEAESKQAILNNLLRRFHAWHGGRSLYQSAPSNGKNGSANTSADALPDPTHVSQVHIHPWFIPKPGELSDVNNQKSELELVSQMDDLRNKINTELVKTGFPEKHLEIIVQPKGQVIATGYAHSDEEAETAIDVIMGMDAVSELLVDIKTVPPAACPVCHPDER